MDLKITLSKSKGFDKNGKEIVEEKTYTAPNPSLGSVRKALDLFSDNNFSALKVENMDKLVDYTVELFGKQFKPEDVYTGLPAEGAFQQLNGYVGEILSTMGAKLKQIPPNQDAAK